VSLSTDLRSDAATSFRVSREEIGLGLLGIALLLTVVTAVTSSVPRYEPGVPLWFQMPPAYFAAYANALVAAFVATRPRTRVLAAMTAGFLTVIPVVLLLPYGHLHDTNRNLLIAIQTLAGTPSGMYRDAYPGFWTFVGFAHYLSGLAPWIFIRLYPLASVAAYAALGYLVLREAMRRTRSSSPVIGVATGISLIVLLAVAPLVWMRTNLAPESYGLAMGMLLVYLAMRRRDGTIFAVAFFAAAAALTVSHPLSPLLVLPALLAVLGMESGAIVGGVKNALKAFPLQIGGTVLAMWIAWITYRSDWIFNHARGIVVDALEKDKEVTGVTRLLEGTEWVLLANVTFLALLALALAPFVLRAWKSDLGRFAILWGVFMGPLLVGTAGGKFFSRPILVLFVPLAAVVGWSYAALDWRRTWKVAAIFLLVLAGIAGSLRNGYVESYDRPTGAEVQAFEYIYAQDEVAYRSSLGIHFTAANAPLDAKGLLQGGGRALAPDQAQFYSLRLVTAQAVTYAALEGAAPSTITGLVCDDASVVFDNGGAIVCRAKPVGRGVGVPFIR